ncbi:hypothetical protein [Pseudomonas aeruginosa]|uniref:hypothetical protein n=1 Tax=Pseudomonas aeruginosa TaxID=287 RepID=UPI00178CC6AC|nr:hypothetical protein [Pseudomonas aeruginosa]MEA8450852.1 hypothetical protein [Pseudomonas aeruginosa]
MSAQEELSERKEEKTPSPRVNNRAAKTFRLISEEGKYKKKTVMSHSTTATGICAAGRASSEKPHNELQSKAA